MTLKPAVSHLRFQQFPNKRGEKHFCLHTECFRGLEKLKANSEGIKLVLSMCNRTSSFAVSELLAHASISSAVRLQVLLCIQLREDSSEGGIFIASWETPRESRTENGIKCDALTSEDLLPLLHSGCDSFLSHVQRASLKAQYCSDCHGLVCASSGPHLGMGHLQSSP